MGIVTGYHFAQAGADVTFLVRPHRQEQLTRPQKLYSYDDNTLKTYDGYTLLTDPTQLADKAFDLVVITLDGASLRAEAGRKVVDELGKALHGTSTGVVLGSVGIDLRSWFVQQSGLAGEQVTNGVLNLFAYEVPPATLPTHPGVNIDLFSAADYAYRHASAFGFSVDDSAPEVAQQFSELYNRSGESQCSVISADEYRVAVAVFPGLAAWELLGWPAAADIDPADQTWQLGADATREFQRLSAFGSAGLAASEQTSAETILGFFQGMERDVLPLDLAAFNAYHHGGKVNGQDHDILREALDRGQAEGADMPALRTLIAQLALD
ncbi:hypothetical protein JRC04_01765 [Mycolicibacterium sp. S2-37]|nr:hypothetical protein [Mycolicibacterium sp. S2-37]